MNVPACKSVTLSTPSVSMLDDSTGPSAAAQRIRRPRRCESPCGCHARRLHEGGPERGVTPAQRPAWDERHEEEEEEEESLQLRALVASIDANLLGGASSTFKLDAQHLIPSLTQAPMATIPLALSACAPARGCASSAPRALPCVIGPRAIAADPIFFNIFREWLSRRVCRVLESGQCCCATSRCTPRLRDLGLPVAKRRSTMPDIAVVHTWHGGLRLRAPSSRGGGRRPPAPPLHLDRKVLRVERRVTRALERERESGERESAFSRATLPAE